MLIEIEPKDGYDVYTTIDVNIQDIAHHALLEQLEKYTKQIMAVWWYNGNQNRRR